MVFLPFANQRPKSDGLNNARLHTPFCCHPRDNFTSDNVYEKFPPCTQYVLPILLKKRAQDKDIGHLYFPLLNPFKNPVKEIPCPSYSLEFCIASFIICGSHSHSAPTRVPISSPFRTVHQLKPSPTIALITPIIIPKVAPPQTALGPFQ